MAEPTPRLIGYRTLLRQSVVKALRELFPDNIGYEQYRLDDLHITIQYPIERNTFPHIMVEYEEDTVESTSIADTTFTAGDGEQYHHWRFSGRIVLEVQVLNAYEMDLILDGLTIALGVDNGLQSSLGDSPLSLNFQTKSVVAGITANSGDPVFDDGGVVYMSTLRFPVQGEFVTRTKNTGTGILIETITVDAVME